MIFYFSKENKACECEMCATKAPSQKHHFIKFLERYNFLQVQNHQTIPQNDIYEMMNKLSRKSFDKWDKEILYLLKHQDHFKIERKRKYPR